ncbi:MAG: NUDIX domain-containing protein [Steroidobacteraceae bacterium]
MSAARSKRSAGIVLYRKRLGILEIFLVHPGGPYWARKDNGAWSIPKGEYEQGEEALQAAQREFLEETGVAVNGPFLALAPVRQPSGKMITAWAAEGDLDPTRLRSNTFSLEWPPKSGVMQSFPEVDRGAWFSLANARSKLSPGQRPLLRDIAEL